jgi:hypothetical protein
MALCYQLFVSIKGREATLFANASGIADAPLKQLGGVMKDMENRFTSFLLC